MPQRTCGIMTTELDFTSEMHIFFIGNIPLMEVIHAYISRFAHSRSTPTSSLVILASTHGDGVVRLTEHNILFQYHPAPSAAAA